MPQKRMECFRLIFNHLAWIEHQFLSGIRDSRKAGSLWGMMRGVGGVRKSIHQSWLTKRLGLGLQLKFLGGSGRDSVGRGQHSSNRVSGISTRTMHQSTTPFLSQTIWPIWASRQLLTLPIVQPLLLVTFGYSLSSEAVVMRQLRRWKRLWRRSLTRNGTFTNTTASGQSGSWSYINEGVFYITKIPRLVPHYRMQFSVISKIIVLLLCRDAVDVFYNPSQVIL